MTERTVAFVLAPGVHLLDLAGPAQAWVTAAEISGSEWRLVYLAETRSVPAHQGTALTAQTEWPDLGPDDIVIVPGWRVGDPRGAGVPIGERLLARIAEHHERGGEVMSVCAGAFALAEAGLLDGRRATTHHEVQDELERRYPRVQVVRDVLYVSDGNLHTSAGITSGVDLTLDRIAQRLGDRVAAQVARSMVVYSRRNGGEPQESALLRHRDHLDGLVHRAQDMIELRYAEKLPLPDLAADLNVSERTLTRAFARTLETTPLRYQQAIRRERAEGLIAAGATVEAAAGEVGFEDARMLRRLRSAAASH